MPITVTFDPTAGSKQSQIIPDASLTSAGAMTPAQVAALGNQAAAIAKVNINAGIIPTSILAFGSEPANNDTITIGTQIFKFVNALGAPDSTMQIRRGTGQTPTLAAFAAAINGTANPLVVQATTPFTEPVNAASTAFATRLELAATRGGTPQAGVSPSIPLSDTLTDASSSWDLTNLNQSAGATTAGARTATGSLIVQAGQVTMGSVYITLPFPPSKILIQAYTVFFPGTNAPKYMTEIVTLFSDPTVNEAIISVGFGATPLIAGNQLTFEIFE